MKRLEVKDLRVEIGEKVIVDGVSFSLPEGEWLVIGGRNGAGKTTLINALTQGIPYTGEAALDGIDIRSMTPKRLAKSIGVLAQNHRAGYGFTVGEVVRLGRYAYADGVFRSKGDAEGKEKVESALTLTGMRELERQSMLSLSGGELQRMFLAQLFAQDPEVLILDEPMNHLDLVFQKQLIKLVKTWLSEGGRAVISVMHDLPVARLTAGYALLLDQGHTVAYGETEEVFTRENLSRAFGMDVNAYYREILSKWEE